METYGELKEAVQAYLDYNDDKVISNIPMFIKFANNECNRVLRTPSHENIIYHEVTLEDEVKWPVPNDLIELRRIYYTDTFETVDRVDIETLPKEKYNYSDISGDGRPVSFARSQDWWYLPRPAVVGTTIAVVYYADTPFFDDDNDTNVNLRMAGQALLYRAIGEGHRFLENMEAAEYWFGKAAEEIEIVQVHANKDENAGSVILQCNNAWF